jgi:hypothetical protein
MNFEDASRHYDAMRHYEQSLRSSREAKRRARGVCVDCGAETRYNGHGRRVSERCGRCANRGVGIAKRGKGPRVEATLALLATGPHRHSEIRDELQISNGHAGEILHRLLKYGLISRPERGLYALAQAAEDWAER